MTSGSYGVSESRNGFKIGFTKSVFFIERFGFMTSVHLEFME